MTVAECHAHINHMNSQFENINKKIDKNSDTNEKIIKILQGNGGGGLIWKVSLLMLRNVWFDRMLTIGLSVLSAVVTAVITAYCLGVFNL